MEIRDKVVVVTGGGSGMGKSMCERFAREGAKGVVVADLRSKPAKAVAESVHGRYMAVDVAQESEIVELIEFTEKEVGPIDLFVSNAGNGVGRGIDASDEQWERSWQVNTMSHVYAARALVPRMVERGGGYLFSTVSAAGLLTQIGSVTYAVSKHAALALAEWLSVTHYDDGIRVSCLCPQAVRTGLTPDGGGIAELDGMMDPDDVAEVVVETIREERFLALSHPEVAEYFRRKGADYERWLSGMRRLQRKTGDAAMPDAPEYWEKT